MFNIKFDAKGLGKLTEKMKSLARSGNLPETKKAVKLAADFVQSNWREAVSSSMDLEFEGKSFRVKRRTGNYEANIRVVYPYENDLSALIEAQAPYAGYIENGVEPYDMKPKLLKGRQFVRIPFRHGVPGSSEGGKTATGLQAMPQTIYNMMQKSKQLGQMSYGQRSKIIQSMEGKKTSTWTTGPYSGMKRTGMAKHGQYMTWRTVSVNSPPNSWWHPGMDPRPISKAIASMSTPFIREMLQNALMKDLSIG